MVTKREITEQVARLDGPVSGEFAALLDRFDEEQLCDRRNFTGHITASGTIVHIPRREVLLLRHRALGKWLAPGGHVDPADESILGAALREIEEETGLTPEQLIPVNVAGGVQYCLEIHSHRIPRNEGKKEDAHFHHDFRYLFAYAGDRRITIDPGESLDYEWLPLDDPYIREEILGVDSIDDLLLGGLEAYEQTVRERQGNDYLVTPLAAYQLKLGNIAFDRGQDARAGEMYERAIRSFADTYDDEYETPPAILSAYWNLALVGKKTGRRDLEVRALEEGLRQCGEFALFDDNFQRELPPLRNALEDARRRGR